MAKGIGTSNLSQIRKACRLKEVRDLPDINIPENTICKPCQIGKQTGFHFIKKEGSTSKPLELIHTDLCGPTRKKSPRGEEYFILFIDYFSRMCWIVLLKHKMKHLKSLKPSKISLKMNKIEKSNVSDLIEEENSYQMNSLNFVNNME